MTATERLRELLDERGVKWDGESYEGVTFWNEETNLAVASDDRDEKLWVSMRLTPEQAVEATLGSFSCTNGERTGDELGPGTCKPTTYDNGYLTDHLEPGEYYEFWEPACACSECGELIPMRRFCPNCGARIEVDE